MDSFLNREHIRVPDDHPRENSLASRTHSRDMRVIGNLRRYSALMEGDRREYWHDWQLEVRKNKQLNETVGISVSQARAAAERASRAESGRRSLSRSLHKLNTERAVKSTVCSQCAKGYEHVRKSNETLIELNRALEDQVSAEKQLRCELKRAIRERLITVDRERHLIESENQTLYNRLQSLQSILDDQKDAQCTPTVQCFPVMLCPCVETAHASTAPRNCQHQDACTETHTHVSKLASSNSRQRRSNDSLHRCRE